MDAKEQRVDDALPIDGPVHRLTDRELARRCLLHVELEPEALALYRYLDECEALVAFQADVVTIGKVVHEQVLAGLERRHTCVRVEDAAELDRVKVGRSAVAHELRRPLV